MTENEAESKNIVSTEWQHLLINIVSHGFLLSFFFFFMEV